MISHIVGACCAVLSFLITPNGSFARRLAIAVGFAIFYELIVYSVKMA